MLIKIIHNNYSLPISVPFIEQIYCDNPYLFLYEMERIKDNHEYTKIDEIKILNGELVIMVSH